MAQLVTLYHKDGCHLCEDTRRDLGAMQAAFALTVREVDITSDPALYERFRNVIPVVDIDGGALLYAPIGQAELRAALSAVARTGSSRGNP